MLVLRIPGLRIGDLPLRSLPENSAQVQERVPFFNVWERVEHALRGVGEGTTPPMHYRGSSKGRAFC